MNIYYVYEWYIVETDEVFYVGKGKGDRAGKIKRNKFFKDMYNSHNCDFRIKIDNLSEEDAFKYEIKLIKYYREYYPEYRLTNQTDGGEGTSGWKPSDEWKTNQSKIQKERWKDEEFRNKMIDIRNDKDSTYQSDDFRNKMSKLVKGENNPNYGNYWTDDMKKKARQNKLGKYNGKNNPNYGNKWNNEQRKHLSELRKNGNWRNENHGMAKKVVCLETGEIFNCIKYAKEKYNGSVTLLGHENVYVKSYHFKEIDDDFIVNKDNLFNELIEFYKECNYKYKIFLCKEDKTFYFGYRELQDITGLGLKKVKSLLKKYNKIEINNKTYIEIKNSRII